MLVSKQETQLFRFSQVSGTGAVVGGWVVAGVGLVGTVGNKVEGPVTFGVVVGF